METRSVRDDAPLECIVVLPMSYTGRGPAESCAQIVAAFPTEGIDTTVLLPRARIPFPSHVNVIETLPLAVRKLPWRWARSWLPQLWRRLFKLLEQRDAARTIVYFWPDVDASVVRKVRAMGFVTIRECINNPCAIARTILDEAFAKARVRGSHAISASRASAETEELHQHSFLFASNAEVEASLKSIGVAESKILPTSYGWSARRFTQVPSRPYRERETCVLFVGSLDVRKGVPELIQAWRRCDLPGKLLLVGALDPMLRDTVESALGAGGIEHLGYVDDIREIYASATMFVFPTHEEGGPQVTYEAAYYGLPIVTTTMGAARLVEDEVSGLIVPRGDPAALARAIERLAKDRGWAEGLGEEARRRTGAFEYENVSRSRTRMLLQAAA